MKKIISFVISLGVMLSIVPSVASAATLPMSLQINSNGDATLRGTLKAINPTSIVVTSWGGDWAVNFTATTKFVRNYGGVATINEFEVGDSITVQGKVNATYFWTIDAKSAQDNSIQTRNGEFNGVISNLIGNTFTLTSKRATLQVTVNPDAKINVQGRNGTLANLANGKTVVAGGVWNTRLSTLAASRLVVKASK